ncbi:MAG: peptidylprolyl isomerase [Bacillota bacterium]
MKKAAVISIIAFVLSICTLRVSGDWMKRPSNQMVLKIGTEQINADYIELLVKENLVKEKKLKKIVDLVVEDALLSVEAAKIGLDKSPEVLDSLGKQREHTIIAMLAKSRYPNLTLSEIGKNFHKFSEEILSSYITKEQATFMRIDPIKALAETAAAPAKRSEVILAKVGQENVTLQDMLDRFGAYKEQNLVETYLTQGENFVLKTMQIKLVQRDFSSLLRKYPVMKEYVLRMRQNMLANAVRAYYLNPYAKYTKNETSKEPIFFKTPKPKIEDLKAYYDKNPERFIIADSIKIRQLVVDKAEKMDEVLAFINQALIKNDTDFRLTIKRFSTARDLNKDGDLGIVYNPILHPEAQIPPIIPASMASVRLFRLKKGDTSAPFRSKEGYHLLYVYDRVDKLVPFENEWAKQTSYKCWQKDERKRIFNELVEKLKSNARINVNKEVMSEMPKRIKLLP